MTICPKHKVRFGGLEKLSCLSPKHTSGANIVTEEEKSQIMFCKDYPTGILNHPDKSRRLPSMKKGSYTFLLNAFVFTLKLKRIFRTG